MLKPKMIETRITLERLAELTELEENDMKDTCQKFAKTMLYNFEFNYYSVYWQEENWLLALLANPEIEYVMKVTP
jgi:uncharacterized protein YaeQ